MSHPTHRIGLSGEYLTASILSLISDNVLLTPNAGLADLIFEYEDTFYRVQVKSKSKQEVHKKNWRFDLRRGSHTKDRKYKKGLIDIFALVSLEHRNIVFIKPHTENQITIIDEHMKNNDAVRNLLDILDKN